MTQYATASDASRRRLISFTLFAMFAISSPMAAQTSKQVFTEPGSTLPFSTAVRAGDFVYVSGALATDAKGQVVAGDVKVQTKQVLDNLSAALTRAGSSMANVAAVTVYLKRAADFAAMNEVYRTYWSANPPVRTTVAADLVLPNALIEVSMIAVPNGGERKVVHPADWMKSPNPYSYGIQSGNTLFLAGLVARNGKDNSAVEGDVKVQTKAVMDNAGQVLAAAGMSFADVVASRVYITDTAMFQDMNEVYRTYFKSDPPARATVKAPLMGPTNQVEITLTAVKDSTRKALTTPNADGTPGRPSPVLSSAVQVGNRLYVSGILGNDATNKGDMAAQTREAMARIGRTLKAAGFDWGHVVDGTVYVTDLTKFADMNTAYRESLTKDFPARATVGVGLVAPDGLVELMFTAVR